MDTDFDSSHDMAYVEYDSDSKRKNSKVSPEKLAFLGKLVQGENNKFYFEN